MRLDSVYVTYWSLRDPLCQSQSLPVLRGLAAGGYRLGLVTYEQAPWAVPAPERARVAASLAAEGIEWAPRDYHKRPPLLSTLYDIAMGVLHTAAFARRSKARLVHGRASVPAAIAWGAARTSGRLFFDDADGPLSEEYVDAGVWSRGSWPHRLTRAVEHACLTRADQVAVLSSLRRDELRSVVGREIAVLPCGVDTSLFRYDPAARERWRRELGLSGTVLVYSGKAGGWYLTEPLLDFARAAGTVLGDVTLLVLTTGDPRPFVDGAAARGVRCVVRAGGRDEMPGLLSAADAGLSFRLDSASQRACSPIKNGEYLACGLPVVTTAGAGDYSALVQRERVGVVAAAFDAPALGASARELAALLETKDVRERCRAVAVAEVGLNEIVVPRYLRLYEGLLGRPGTTGA